ncbi:S8 family serine peptidase [Rhodothermus sp. AH-315-K08]|nr:S8 family serine peptidase [Rhodothermus sp. AH-315-K08]
MTPRKLARALIISLFLGFAGGDLLYAQLTRLDDPRHFSEVDIYVDDDGVEYATVININFKEAVLNPSSAASTVLVDDVPARYGALVNSLRGLQRNHGDFVLEKRFSWAIPGGNPVAHRRSGKTVYTSDWSQAFILRFTQPVPLEEVIDSLSRVGVIGSVEGPQRGMMLDSPYESRAQFGPTSGPVMVAPNDWAYTTSQQWYLDRINAEGAWDIEKGDGITIGIVDSWNFSITEVHPDLDGKLTKDSGNSWGGITQAMMDGVDVINASWVTSNTSDHEKAVHDALNARIVIVAGAGNGSNNVPTGSVQYPAAYNFPSVAYPNLTAQVIAVGATDEDDKYLAAGMCAFHPAVPPAAEYYTPDWCPYNYSPGTDPIGDPTNAFIDVAAPGIAVKVLLSHLSGGIQHTQIVNSGTSFASPMVSALAALLLGVDATLTVQEVYELITQGADKVDRYTYDSVGWNQYLGYGRIDAQLSLCSLAASCSLAAPTNFSVTNAGSIGENPALWWDGTEGVLTNYIVYRQNPGSSTWVQIGTTTSTDYVDTSLVMEAKTGSNTYYFRVTAEDFGGTETAPSNQDGIFADVSWKRGDDVVAHRFALDVNYPNPFNPSTTFRYSIPGQTRVTLTVFDMLGREVARPVDEVQEQGAHSLTFDASELPTGMYLYKLVTSFGETTRTMALTK